MLLNPRTGAEVDSATVKTEEEALVEFDRLREKYHVPDAVPLELPDNYKKTH